MLISAFSNTPIIPNVDLQTEADFRLYQEDAFLILDWLMDEPISYGNKQRTKANLFLMDWVNGAPYISVKPHSALLQYTYENPAFLPIFMGAAARHQVNHPDDHKFIDASVAGINAILRVYQADRGTIIQSEKINQLIRLQKNGELRAWAEDIWKSMNGQKINPL